MIIYGNNLHEKLQGLAISRDYLKYNTPFCDLVDDPDWQLDIDLALNFNSAINGNLESATKLVQDLTLNSAILDGSTLEFYISKITYNPVFRSAISEMRARWSTPDLFSDDFQNLLLNALQDCLNSPCNLFAETSDSVARLAQVASTKTNFNTFGVGQLSASFTNMINGLDETIMTKIPAVFSRAYKEVIQASSQAFTKTQKVLAGEENLTTFNDRIANGKSLRDPASVFRYTPDVQDYYDTSAATSNALAKVKQELGGCFGRFEYNFRYNPYSPRDNKKTSIGSTVGAVDSVTYDADSNGQPQRVKTNTTELEKHVAITTTPPNKRGIAEPNDVEISQTYELRPNGPSRYTIFGAYIDKVNKIAYVDDYDKTADDVATLQGIGNLGTEYRFAPSYIARDDLGYESLRTNGNALIDPEGANADTVAQYLADGWDHKLTAEGMETYYPTSERTYNDGVALSQGLINSFFNEPGRKNRNRSIKKYQLDQQAYVAVRPYNAGYNWSYFKIIDVAASQEDIFVDFTLGAWQYMLNTFYFGAEMDKGNAEPIGNTGWTKVIKNSQSTVKEPLEIKICLGPLDSIKDTNSNANPLDVINSLDDITIAGAGDTLLPAIED